MAGACLLAKDFLFGSWQQVVPADSDRVYSKLSHSHYVTSGKATARLGWSQGAWGALLTQAGLVSGTSHQLHPQAT